MADKVKVELLKPLNGAEIGSKAEYSKADFEMLKAKGAVKAVDEPKKDAPKKGKKKS